MARRTVRSQCPNPVRCSAASPNQANLDAELLRKAGVTDDWVSSAMRCSYCGLVYSVEHHPGRPLVKVPRGYFANDLIQLDHWRPLLADLTVGIPQ